MTKKKTPKRDPNSPSNYSKLATEQKVANLSSKDRNWPAHDRHLRRDCSPRRQHLVHFKKWYSIHTRGK